MSSLARRAQPPFATALGALCLAGVLALAGCKPTPAPSAATAPVPAMPLEEQLMRAALPGWGPLGVQTQVKFKLEGEQDQPNASYDASAVAVLPDGDDKAVLIVEGQMLGAGHPSPGVLAAYWLERKQGQWVRVAAQDPVDQVGFFGSLGKVKLVDLAPGLKGIAVESGSCWQGSCMTALSVYVPQGQRFGLAHQGGLSESTRGARPGCEEALNAKPGSLLTLRPDEADFGDGCWQIDSQWRVLPRPTTPANVSAAPDKAIPGDIEIRFTGQQANLLPLPTAPAASAAATSSAAQGTAATRESTEDEDAPITYRVQHQPIREMQVLRFEGGAYKVVSGKNPNRGF